MQFERGSFLSKKSIEKSLLLPCRERLSLRFASSGSVGITGGPAVHAKKMWLDFCGITSSSLKALLPRLSGVKELDLCRNALGPALQYYAQSPVPGQQWGFRVNITPMFPE